MKNLKKKKKSYRKAYKNVKNMLVANIIIIPQSSILMSHFVLWRLVSSMAYQNVKHTRLAASDNAHLFL